MSPSTPREGETKLILRNFSSDSTEPLTDLDKLRHPDESAPLDWGKLVGMQDGGPIYRP